MPNTTKSTVDRLIDGLEDYCLDRESFDARYICGQLFLHGQASAYDIGMPGRYHGEEATRKTYIFNWFSSLWAKSINRYHELVGSYLIYDSFLDANVIKLAALTRPVNVREYVSCLTRLVESQTFVSLRVERYRNNAKRLYALLVDNEDIGYKTASSVLLNAANDLSEAIERLKKDYTGEALYPSATLTFFSVSDQLNNMLHAYTEMLCLPTARNHDQLWLYGEPTSKLTEAFPQTSLKEFAASHAHEVMVLALNNLQLMIEVILYVNNAAQEINKTIDNLTSVNK